MASLEPTEICDLCILGGGYAGINALNAASKYLPEGARVVVIARERAWGGQWVDQYDFVRLHQPYQQFTAGEREWELKKEIHYLASKKEILQHFENIAAACVTEKRLDLVKLFEYEFVEHRVDSIGKVVEVDAVPLGSDLGLPTMRIAASRFIIADGSNIHAKQPLEFSAASQVHSMSAVNVSMPDWEVKMRFSKDKDKPIIIIGSGKTAIDVINYLCKNLPGAAQRIMCISGRGTWFFVRDAMLFDSMPQLIAAYDGSDAEAVCKQMAERGLLHSPIPDPRSFVLGMCSRAEVAIVQDALSPPEGKVIKAHLMDVISENGVPMLKLRDLDGQTAFTKNISSGTFLVNCTDHIDPTGQASFEPILSEDGLVLRPQALCGFTGPTANMCTHLFYSGGLEPLWRNLPRVEFDHADKCSSGFKMLMTVIMSSVLVTRALPKHVRKNYMVKPPPAEAGTVESIQKLMPRMIENYQKLTARYTDEKPQRKPLSILGGNLVRSKL